MILIRYIFRDHLVGHIPATAAELSPCPQMPTPKLLLQMRKFSHQLVRTLPLQPLDQRLIVTCGGIDTNRCRWSFATCPFRIVIVLPQISRIMSLTRVPLPPSTLPDGIWSSIPDANVSRIPCVLRVILFIRTHYHSIKMLKRAKGRVQLRVSEEAKTKAVHQCADLLERRLFRGTACRANDQPVR